MQKIFKAPRASRSFGRIPLNSETSNETPTLVIEGADQLASLNSDNASSFDVIMIEQRSIESQAHPKQKQPCALEVQDPKNKEGVVDRLGNIILKMKSKRLQIIMNEVQRILHNYK